MDTLYLGTLDTSGGDDDDFHTFGPEMNVLAALQDRGTDTLQIRSRFMSNSIRKEVRKD